MCDVRADCESKLASVTLQRVLCDRVQHLLILSMCELMLSCSFMYVLHFAFCSSRCLMAMYGNQHGERPATQQQQCLYAAPISLHTPTNYHIVTRTSPARHRLSVACSGTPCTTLPLTVRH